MAYRCTQCGRHQDGQSHDNICPGCRPPDVRPAGGEQKPVRCISCGQASLAQERAPTFECPHCGVLQQAR